jgi:hypothetical protein
MGDRSRRRLDFVVEGFGLFGDEPSGSISHLVGWVHYLGSLRGRDLWGDLDVDGRIISSRSMGDRS